MLINKKNILAAAMMAGLGLTGAASAFTLQTDGNATPVLVATADIINATTDIGIDENFTVSLTGTDNILGRTTGFTIRYSLNNGATFGDDLTTADISVGPAAFGGDANNAWIPTIAAGGTTADNFVVILFSPPVAPVGTYALRTGVLLDIADANVVVNPTPGDGQILDTLTALQTAGQQVLATVQFIDPVTASNIMAPASLAILQSGDPVVFSCDATDGDTTKTIDVGALSRPAKTYFSSTGVINSPDSPYFNAGTISSSVAPGFTSFDYLATDTFTTVLTGDFSAFTPTSATRGVFLSSDANCDTNNVQGVVNTANNTVTFANYTGAAVNTTVDGFTMYVCAEVPAGNTTVIDATTISETTTFTRGSVTSTGGSSNCALLPLRYNGSVVDVYHINPASNPTAQSFIRVINPSDQAGTVTLTGIDDTGAPAAAPITLLLGARQSIQINSDDLEFGNAAKGLTGAWGNGTGKWRGTVTGEFANMLVQSMNRNNNDGTVTNLTDADNRGEQVLNSLFNNN